MKKTTILVAAAAVAMSMAARADPIGFDRQVDERRAGMRGGDRPVRKLDQLKSGKGRL